MESDLTFAVAGMTCASCASFVEKKLSGISGFEYVSVNLASGKVYLVTDGKSGWEEFASTVREAGYEPLRELDSDDEKRFACAVRRLILAWLMSAPVMILMIFHMIGFHMPWLPFLEAFLGIAVLAIPGRGIIRGAWIAVSHHHANMDVLVTLGTIASWLTAILSIAGFPLWSLGSMAVMLPAFHLTGRLVEERLRRKSRVDLRSLTSNGKNTVHVVEQQGVRRLPIEVIKVGMIIRVHQGEQIPLDGKIVKGKGSVSEAMITGEAVPVLKNLGDSVIGGTVLENGLLELEVSKIGKDTFLARMLKLVEQAQGVQIPLQAVADKISGIFVPAILLLALLTLGLWMIFFKDLFPIIEQAAVFLPWIPSNAPPWTIAVFAMISTLVVACPCALGLATPMALSVGSSLAARRGLLIKGGEALQTSGELDVLVFDKTATLTLGKPEVLYSELKPEDRMNVAALEAFSVHPLAIAIVNWASSFDNANIESIEVHDVKEVAGEGIWACVNGIPYSIGAPKKDVSALGVRGTAVEVFRDGVSAGCLVLRDPVRKEAKVAVQALRERNVKPIIATGDGKIEALAVAKEIGIPAEDVHAQLKPEDKLRLVQSYQQAGLRTGMIGDGINDAAALRASDVGFALAQGTDLSMEAGDVVIIRGGLEGIVEALELSGLIVKKIRENLIWAFAYNIIALPLAVLAFIHPLVAEIAMSLSSVGLILNSIGIRHQYKKRYKKVFKHTEH